MIAASAALKKAMQTDRSFEYNAEFVLKDNTTFTLTEDDLCAGGCKIELTAGSSSLPLGCSLCRCLTLSFYNFEDQYAEYDFYGAQITITATMNLDGTDEVLNLGTFTVTEPEEYGTTVNLVAYDNFYKADKTYSTNLTFPCTAQAVFNDACTKSGLIPLTSTFKNYTYQVKKKPENLSCRQVIGLCAMLAGGNAIVSGNGVKIISYDPTQLDQMTFTDGGIFDDGTPVYQTGANVNGGTFNPWNTGAVLDGGGFNELRDVQIFTDDVMSQTISTDDIVITGVRIVNGEKKYLSGSEGYVIECENALTDGNESTAASLIGTAINGMTFRSFEISLPSYPLAEFLDVAFIERSGVMYASFITDIDFNFKGVTTLKCSADSPVRNSSKSFQVSTSTYRTLRNMLQEEQSEREVMEADLNTKINSKAGLYSTVTTSGGASTFYLHDKPTLADSKIVWKMTAEAWAVTTNYKGSSTTWNGGMTVDGNVIANIMSAIGINFNWGTGGTLTLGGSGNGNGILKVLNASGTQIGQWNNAGITINKGTIQGPSIVSGGSNDTNGTICVILPTDSNRLYLDRYGFTIRSGTAYNTTIFEINGYGIAFEDGDEIDAYGDTGDGVVDFPDFQMCSSNGVALAYYRSGSVDHGVIVNSARTYVEGNFLVNGTKSRLAETSEDPVLLYAYETPTPLFGDVGTGRTGANGVAVISIEYLFDDTINTDIEYAVFLQKEGQGDLWIDEKQSTFFVVRGTPDLPFAWELKAVQRGYENTRLESMSVLDEEEDDGLYQSLANELKQSDMEMDSLFE